MDDDEDGSEEDISGVVSSDEEGNPLPAVKAERKHKKSKRKSKEKPAVEVNDKFLLRD